MFIHTRFIAEDPISKYRKTTKEYHTHSGFVDFMIHELSWVSIAMIKHQNQPGEERVDFSDFSLQYFFIVHLPRKSGKGVRKSDFRNCRGSYGGVLLTGLLDSLDF